MSSERSYWGWGYAGHDITAKALRNTIHFMCQALGVRPEKIQAPKPISDIRLRPPRFSLPTPLHALCTDDTLARCSHSYGKSYNDIIRGLRGEYPNPPDYVAFPTTEEDLQALMQFAEAHRVALIPFGGGTSVVGGVEPVISPHYTGCISVDLRAFNKLLEVDKRSRCARFQAGIYGPALEAALKPHGLTLRHFPQSFEFSTLGGWIATRAGGHYATLYTHIDDLVESVRLVTPQGAAETRRLPGSGAGPSEERFILGSEGTMGFITEAWVKLQALPAFKQTVTVQFKHYADGVNAVRLLSQSGLHPSNCRLVDQMESFGMGLGSGAGAVLILGFESSCVRVDDKMQQALALIEEQGGELLNQSDDTASDNADTWKESFLQAPYMRDEFAQMGIIAETFETAITWDKFDAFHQRMMGEVRECILKTCGAGMITCRFTHVYPDGPAPYFTVIARTALGKELDHWQAIKDTASRIIIEMGATITHHHAVGRDHMPYYAAQRSTFFHGVLKGAKQQIDPEMILNPGVLLD